jgi:type II secretory pathway pseudopilin PulG
MLNFLEKVPFLGTAVTFVTGNVRLVIEYALIALTIVSAATAIALWYRTNYLEARNDELRERVVNVELINEAQDKTISDLQETREQDAAVLAGLIADYDKLSKADTAARKKLSNLEKRNAKVHGYLDESLPPELGCMLNDSCTATQTSGAGGQGSAAESSAGTVQGARTTGNPK